MKIDHHWSCVLPFNPITLNTVQNYRDNNDIHISNQQMVSTEEFLCLFFQTFIRGNLNKSKETEAKTSYGGCVIEEFQTDVPNHFCASSLWLTWHVHSVCHAETAWSGRISHSAFFELLLILANGCCWSVTEFLYLPVHNSIMTSIVVQLQNPLRICWSLCVFFHSNNTWNTQTLQISKFFLASFTPAKDLGLNK